MKILLVSGSLREKSFNTQLMHMAQNALADLAEVRILDWSDLPLFNQDDENPCFLPWTNAGMPSYGPMESGFLRLNTIK